MSESKVTAVFGGQWGSEGKGDLIAELAFDYDVHIRVGAPNAGHSHVAHNRLWKMQSIPVGWINPKANLFIGAGGLINARILRKEIEAVAEVDPSIYKRLRIDGKCGIIDEDMHNEGHTEGEMHKRIGSTGEGVGLAREARLARDPARFYMFRDLCDRDSYFRPFLMENTAYAINSYIDMGHNVLLEGAQGQGLSIIHGSWPFCTTTDPGPAQLCADIGIAPTRLTDVICVFRIMPIRVAGNSGPLPNETTWEKFKEEHGAITHFERTTVTNKVRRIAYWSDEIAKDCVMRHAPTEIALTFMDYYDKECNGIKEWDLLTNKAMSFIRDLELMLGVPVMYVGTAPHNVIRR